MNDSWEPIETDFEQNPADVVATDEFHEEVPTFARQGKRRPAILLSTVTACSLVAILAMRTLTGGIGQVMADTGVEDAVSGFLDFVRKGEVKQEQQKQRTGDPFADLVTDQYASLQIPPSQLRSNPFVTPWSAARASSFNVPQTRMTASERRAMRRDELVSCRELLMVESVMTGHTPLATINDRILRIGEHIHLEEENATCILQSVHADGVVMMARDEELNLETTIRIYLRRE